MFGIAMQKKGRSGDMSAFDVLSIANYGVSGADLANAYAAENGLRASDDDGGTPLEFTAELAGVCGRVKTEALYDRPVALQG